MTTKEAFDQALEDTISNFKGAFAPAGTTSEELYAELMKDYVPNRSLRMLDNLCTDFYAKKEKHLRMQKKNNKIS